MLCWMGVKEHDKMWQQHFAPNPYREVSWVAPQVFYQASSPCSPPLSSAQCRGIAAKHIIINRAGSSWHCIPPSFFLAHSWSSQRYQDTLTAEDSSSWVFLLHKSSLALLQYCCHSFSNCFPWCAKYFFKKYKSNALQRVTVKNNPGKQKQPRKPNS